MALRARCDQRNGYHKLSVQLGKEWAEGFAGSSSVSMRASCGLVAMHGR